MSLLCRVEDKMANCKCEFSRELNQTYISVNENSANVAYITGKVQEKWGKVVLIPGNGLPIQDEEGTRG